MAMAMQKKLNVIKNPFTFILCIVIINLNYICEGPATARGEPNTLRQKPTLQDHFRRDVRHFRQIRRYPTDPSVRIIEALFKLLSTL